MKKSFSIITLVLALILTPITSLHAYAETAEEVSTPPVEITADEFENETCSAQPETVSLTMSDPDEDPEEPSEEEPEEPEEPDDPADDGADDPADDGACDGDGAAEGDGEGDGTYEEPDDQELEKKSISVLKLNLKK